MTSTAENNREHDLDVDQFKAALNLLRVGQAYWSGVYKYTNEFMQPFWIALNSFLTTEKDKIVRHQPIDTLKDYLELMQFNWQVAGKGLASTLNMEIGRAHV